MGININESMVTHTDNDAAKTLTAGSIQHGLKRHYGTKLSRLREWHRAGHITVRTVQTALNTADALTKALPKQTFYQFLPQLLGQEDVDWDNLGRDAKP